MRLERLLIPFFLGCVSASAADWLTDGGNPQRTAWQEDETIFTVENVHQTKLLWKIKLDNEPRQMHALLPALIAEKVATPQGTKEVALVAGVSDNLFAIDVERGELLWSKQFGNASSLFALSRRDDCNAGHRPRRQRRRIHRLRRFMGRQIATA